MQWDWCYSCEVVFGEIYDLKGAWYMDNHLKGNHLIEGAGKKKKLDIEYECWEYDVTIPCGHPVPSGVEKNSVMKPAHKI